MSRVLEFMRKTATLVYRQQNYEADEAAEPQEQDLEIKQFSSACYSLYQVCIIITCSLITHLNTQTFQAFQSTNCLQNVFN